MTNPRRATRVDFLTVLTLSLLACVFLVLLGRLGEKHSVAVYAYIIALAFWIACTLTYVIRTGSARLHDIDRSGWWLICLLVPYVNVVFLFALLLIPGNPRENSFGPAPT